MLLSFITKKKSYVRFDVCVFPYFITLSEKKNDQVLSMLFVCFSFGLKMLNIQKIHFQLQIE